MIIIKHILKISKLHKNIVKILFKFPVSIYYICKWIHRALSKNSGKKCSFLASNHQSTVNGKIPSINAINKTLKRACIRADVEVVTSHALRHTHASILLLKEVSVPYISKRLGHRNTSITTDIYSYVLDELESKSEQLSTDILGQFYD